MKKKHALIFILAVSTCLAFADERKELQTVKTQINIMSKAINILLLGKYDKAVKYFQDGINSLEQLNDKKSILATVHIDLAHTFRKQKKNQLALKNLKAAYQVLKSLPSSDPKILILLNKKIKKLSM